MIKVIEASNSTPVNSSLNESWKCVWNFFFSSRCFAVFQNTTTLYYNEMCDNFFSSFFPRFVAFAAHCWFREYVLSIFLIFHALTLAYYQWYENHTNVSTFFILFLNFYDFLLRWKIYNTINRLYELLLHT